MGLLYIIDFPGLRPATGNIVEYFGRVTSRLVAPSRPLQLTIRDMTLPGIIAGETSQKWAAIRVINSSENDLSGLTLTCILDSG